MAFAHILMLGLIDGASVGVTVDPPVTVGDLQTLSIEQFYAVDFSTNTRQPLNRKQWLMLQRMISMMRRDRLRTMKDLRFAEKHSTGLRSGLMPMGNG